MDMHLAARGAAAGEEDPREREARTWFVLHSRLGEHDLGENVPYNSSRREVCFTSAAFDRNIVAVKQGSMLERTGSVVHQRQHDNSGANKIQHVLASFTRFFWSVRPFALLGHRRDDTLLQEREGQRFMRGGELVRLFLGWRTHVGGGGSRLTG